MNGKHTNYTFDFANEVERIFNDFPQLRTNTVFVNAADNPRKYIFGSEESARHPGWDELLGEAEEKIQKEGGSGSRVNFKGSGLNLVILDPHDAPLLMHPLDIDLLRTLNHETGHVLLGLGIAKICNENSADAFAAIRHLQRFGNDPQDLALLSSSRSHSMAISRRTGHLTTLVIDQIIKDSKHIDFKSNSPGETIVAAAYYAANYTPTVMEQEEVRKYIAGAIPDTGLGQSKKHQVELLASTALTTPDRFSFLIGLSVFRPFFGPEGAVLRGEHVQFDATISTKFRDEFIKRAKYFELNELVAELEQDKGDNSPLNHVARKAATTLKPR